jgi:high affinity Mn2+ porin
MLGDGGLNYAPEMVGEVYYKFHLLKPLFLTLNYQYVLNVGYNADRGNVHFIGARCHFEF